MGRSMNKAECLIEMERLYLQRAYSDIEMAERLGVDRTTAYRYRMELSSGDIALPIEQDDNGKWKINRAAYLSNVRVNLYESLSLYLAARRAAQQSRLAGKHAASALEKIAVALRQPMTERLVRAADKVLTAQIDARRVKIFETIARGWAERIPVRVQYRALHAEETRSHLLHPYLIEPSPWSDSVYVIAYSETMRGITPFKIERIEQAALSTGKFEIPDDFDEDELLKHAWGIWRREGEPQTVRLKFAPGAATRRLKESTWHPLEQVTDTEDGGCIWEAPIAEWREMLPWVRGWGADCEVLAPEKLRDTIKNTVQALSRRYQVSSNAPTLPLYLPYAKTNPDNRDEIHLLLYHLIDVGQVAHSLWQNVLTPSIRQRIAEMLRLDVDASGRFLAFLAALHDLGKASPAYQKKYGLRWLKTALTRAGLQLGAVADGRSYDPATPHGLITAWALQTLLPEMLGVEPRFARKMAIALGGHHGTWPNTADTKRLRDTTAWDSLRRDLFLQLQGVFAPPVSVAPPPTAAEMNVFLTILSGLTSVADWVGSRNKERFGFIGRAMPPRKYARQSRQLADEELNALGWIAWQPDGTVKSFAETFAYLGFESPRKFQQAAIDAASGVQEPTLLIIEAPTGSGKTEAALYIADTWLQRNRGRGLYVAMPTQATSNQMFRRVRDYLKERYPADLVNLHLAHGQAVWSDDVRDIALQRVGDSDKDRVAAMAWFRPRKRTLLAPFGVGTVDQTLMSILQTRHFFVRLFGLAHKVVIFDEVHAYDTYMNTLFHRLLTWLNAIGTSVIILSATLPAKTREELLAAYAGQGLGEHKPLYPALALANTSQHRVVSLPGPEKYTLQIAWSVGRSPDAIAAFLKGELGQGGCAAVICNTVRRAQDVYRAIKNAGIVSDDDLILFHGRFPPVWRKGIEASVLAKFGKGVDRPSKAIVVATQVIEQSLDIDFDVMITDLAPVDLLLQRAGRLHRHKRNERYGLPRRLVIAEPEKDGNGLPRFENDKFYGEYILLRSYLALREKTAILMPDETPALIEAVYDDEAMLPFPDERWEIANRQYHDAFRNAEREKKRKAGRFLVLEPSKSRYLEANAGLEEDDPTMHTAFRAQTRDIDLSLTVICFHKKPNGQIGVYNEAGNFVPVDPDGDTSYRQTRLLLQNAVSIQHKGIVFPLLEQKIPDSWQQEASLRYCRYLVFEGGVSRDIAGYTLTLTPEVGLSIIKQEAK